MDAWAGAHCHAFVCLTRLHHFVYMMYDLRIAYDMHIHECMNIVDGY